MTHTLAIDTTSDMLSLAVGREGEATALHYVRTGPAMTGSLFSVISGLLERARLEPSALGLVVAARGPGSFTGTRIGLAVARTFTLVHRMPVVGVDSLHLLAAQGQPQEGNRVHALLNCARDEVYHAAYLFRDGAWLPEAPIAMTTFAALPGLVGSEPVVLRRFSEKPVKGDQVLDTLKRAPLLHPQPDAALLLTVGRALLAQVGPGNPPPGAEPIYIKTEAFRKWKP